MIRKAETEKRPADLLLRARRVRLGYCKDERLANELDLDPKQDLELAQELEVTR
jgi:hypothetical protein